jgi:hypothetical protein
VEILFVKSARKHKIGRAKAVYVMLTSTPTIELVHAREEWKWVGLDERGLLLEIIAIKEHAKLTVIHVMPRDFRRKL